MTTLTREEVLRMAREAGFATITVVQNGMLVVDIAPTVRPLDKLIKFAEAIIREIHKPHA